MRYWFTSYVGPDWQPLYGYSRLFREQVLALYNRFQLRSAGPGQAFGNGFFVPHHIHGARAYALAHVAIKRFTWYEYQPVDKNGLTPVFTLHLQVVLAREDQQLDMAKFLFDDSIKITFPLNYPSQKPSIFADYKYKQMGCVYMLDGGRLCVMNSSDDWRPGDNVCRAVEVAVAWIVENQQKLKLGGRENALPSARNP